ncbi:SVM family protein [Paulownia witches'-broom phytoplasma]|uniref:SVM family protein n=1 Tax=Paulownia witches'-broom phytoplasma TaxID=39647 RepID=A0ABX8TPD2_9MOLU|nr:SVM family protein [Paulownia witches'-broom phytoplasma]QYC30822.1 SVM family protein [Paulownia witches'-broom phytoplasma]
MFKLKKQLYLFKIVLFVFLGIFLITDNHQVMAMDDNSSSSQNNNYILNNSCDFFLETQSVFINERNWQLAGTWKNVVLNIQNMNKNINPESYQKLFSLSMKLGSLIQITEQQGKLIYELKEIRKKIITSINIRQNPQDLLKQEEEKRVKFHDLDKQFFSIK